MLVYKMGCWCVNIQDAVLVYGIGCFYTGWVLVYRMGCLYMGWCVSILDQV